MAMQPTSASGVYVAPADEGDGSERQPPHVLGAWIQRMLVDGAQPHEERVRELQERYSRVAFECDVSLLMQAVRAMSEALDNDESESLMGSNPGWRQRLGGAQRDHAAPVSALYNRVCSCADTVESRAADVASSHAATVSESRKVLVELGLEEQRLATVLMRIERWLQLMWKGLTSSRPVPGDSGSVHKLRVLVDRTDQFRSQLMRLQQIADLSQDTCRIGQQVIDKRDALLAMINGELTAARNHWDKRFRQLVAERDANPHANFTPPGEAAAREASEVLKEQADICARACLDLEIAEQELGQQVATLHERFKLGG